MVEQRKVVTIIPAKKKVGNNITEEEEPKLRVVAYCRVSTDTEEQASSYEAQVEHYTEYINKRDDWELAGILLMRVSVEQLQKSVKVLIT